MYNRDSLSTHLSGFHIVIIEISFKIIHCENETLDAAYHPKIHADVGPSWAYAKMQKGRMPAQLSLLLETND